MGFAAFEVEIDMTFALADGAGLCPINFFAAFVIVLEHGEAQFFHNGGDDAVGIGQHGDFVFGSDLAVIGEDDDRPAFV